MGLKEDFENIAPIKCLIAGLALCAVYYFVIYDSGDSIVATSAQIQEENNELSKRLAAVQAALANKTAFEKKVLDFTKEFEDIMRFFPTTLDMIETQKEITKKIESNKNRLININTVTLESRFAGYSENGLDVEMLGGFHDIMSFLSDITKMSKVMDFRAMNFDSQNPTEEMSLIKFRLRLSVFAQEKKDNKPSEVEKK